MVSTKQQRLPNRFRGALLAVSLVALLISSGCDLVEDEGPQAVVAEFCKLDLLGARISGGSDAGIGKYASWEPQQDWQRIVVIEGYRISNPRRKDRTAEVTVIYDVLGVLEGERWTSNASGSGWKRELSIPEIVTFELDSADGKKWVIREPRIPPHVSLTRVDNQLLSTSKVDG